MKNREKHRRAMIRRISVDTILNAKKGDESAIQTILNYYKGYMLDSGVPNPNPPPQEGSEFGVA